jgi:hypothetical protein
MYALRPYEQRWHCHNWQDCFHGTAFGKAKGPRGVIEFNEAYIVNHMLGVAQRAISIAIVVVH